MMKYHLCNVMTYISIWQVPSGISSTIHPLNMIKIIRILTDQQNTIKETSGETDLVIFIIIPAEINLNSQLK